MIKRIIYSTALWFIIIGTISWAVAYVTGQTVPTFISTYTVNYGNGITTTLYKLDIYSYLKALEYNMNIPLKQMFYSMPQLWQPKWKDIINITFLGKLIYNVIIWLLNMTVWWNNIIFFVPTKLLIQPIVLIATLLGIDLQRYNIIEIVYIIYRSTPPIIPYWS